MTRIRALPNRVLATKGDFGEHVTKTGIIISSTDGKASGIVPRWFQVLEVGRGIDYVTPGDWILVEHGRWTEGMEVEDDRLDEGDRVWQIDPKGILGISDQEPQDRGTGYNASTAWT
jgi:co-chaperonin GroES (HSP10)